MNRSKAADPEENKQEVSCILILPLKIMFSGLILDNVHFVVMGLANPISVARFNGELLENSFEHLIIFCHFCTITLTIMQQKGI